MYECASEAKVIFTIIHWGAMDCRCDLQIKISLPQEYKLGQTIIHQVEAQFPQGATLRQLRTESLTVCIPSLP